MKHCINIPWLHTKLKILPIICLGLLSLSSCICDDSNNIQQDPKEVRVNLIVSLKTTEPSSRASESTEADAVGNEYKIFKEDFQVLIYNPDGSYRTQVAITGCHKNAYNLYTLEGKFYTFRESDLDKQYKMVIFANAEKGTSKIATRDWQQNIPESALYQELRFSYDNGETFTVNMLRNTEDNTERIPMWGSKSTYIKDGATYRINLVRALAKVTVSLSPSIGYKEITSVTMEGSYTSGMLVPKNDAQEPHVPTDVMPHTGSIPFATYIQDGTKYYCLYLPEQEAYNPTTGKGAKMTVTIDGEAYTLHFASYAGEGNTGNSQEPNAFRPILRNNWYKYVIQSVTPKNTNLGIKYQVAEWTSKDPFAISFN